MTDPTTLTSLSSDLSATVARVAPAIVSVHSHRLRATGFVWIAGHTQVYNNQAQLIIEQIKGVEVTAEEITALLPTFAACSS